MNFIESCRADVTGGCLPLITYYNIVVMTESHLRCYVVSDVPYDTMRNDTIQYIWGLRVLKS